jgi:hypothetical protein
LAYLTPDERAKWDQLLASSEKFREREHCENRFYNFVKTAWPHVESRPFIDNWHVGVLCEYLQAITENKIANLLINIPPGFSKSLLCCVFWPMWEWARDASIRWFFASYDQKLSTRDSVRCRTLLESPWYQSLWPHRLKDDQNQKTYYETEQGGWRLATSIGGHGTGEHPHRIVVDDPHSIEGAESAADRDMVKRWWTLTMSSRGVSVGVRRVAIMQRTHRDDFSALVLEEGGWEHICLPMRYEINHPQRWKGDPRKEEGVLLAPQYLDETAVKKLVASLRLVHGNYGVASQLQQRPDVSGSAEWPGEYFGAHIWFEEWPRQLEIKTLALDPSKGKDAKYGDYAAFVRLGRDSSGILYCEADLRRITAEEVVASGVEHVKVFQPEGFAVEGNTFQELFITLFLAAVDRGNPKAQAPGLHLPIYTLVNTVNKLVRIRRIGPFLEQKQLRFKANSPGTKLLVQQLRDFPNGDHDDGPDSLEMALRLMIDLWNRGTGPAPVQGFIP